MGEGVDLGAGDAAQTCVQTLHAGRHLVVCEYQVCIHALKHVLSDFAHIVMREVDFLDDARQIREPTAVVRAQDALIGNVQAL